MTEFFFKNSYSFLSSKQENEGFSSYPLFNAEFHKGIVGLDLRWKYDIKLVPANRQASDWLPNQAG